MSVLDQMGQYKPPGADHEAAPCTPQIHRTSATTVAHRERLQYRPIQDPNQMGADRPMSCCLEQRREFCGRRGLQTKSHAIALRVRLHPVVDEFDEMVPVAVGFDAA
jgi:hypothetical protein